MFMRLYGQARSAFRVHTRLNKIRQALQVLNQWVVAFASMPEQNLEFHR